MTDNACQLIGALSISLLLIILVGLVAVWISARVVVMLNFANVDVVTHVSVRFQFFKSDETFCNILGCIRLEIVFL